MLLALAIRRQKAVIRRGSKIDPKLTRILLGSYDLNGRRPPLWGDRLSPKEVTPKRSRLSGDRYYFAVSVFGQFYGWTQARIRRIHERSFLDPGRYVPGVEHTRRCVRDLVEVVCVQLEIAGLNLAVEDSPFQMLASPGAISSGGCDQQAATQSACAVPCVSAAASSVTTSLAAISSLGLPGSNAAGLTIGA